MNHLKDDFEFHVHWKPFLLNPYIHDGETVPIMDYLRLKFGEKAAQKFISGSSPVSQRGKELVSRVHSCFFSFLRTVIELVAYITFCCLCAWCIYFIQGINFNPNRLVVPTKKPHIILDFAAKHGKQHEMQEVLFRAYFSEGRNVASDEVLKDLVCEVGLDANEALASLSDRDYVCEFEKGIKEVQSKGKLFHRLLFILYIATYGNLLWLLEMLTED